MDYIKSCIIGFVLGTLMILIFVIFPATLLYLALSVFGVKISFWACVVTIMLISVISSFFRK